MSLQQIRDEQRKQGEILLKLTADVDELLKKIADANNDPAIAEMLADARAMTAKMQELESKYTSGGSPVEEPPV